MLIRFLQEWCNFAPPAEVELERPVAEILIQRGMAEPAMPQQVEVKRGPGRPRKEKHDGSGPHT